MLTVISNQDQPVSAPAPSHSSDFLSLPAEIRQLIYHYHFRGEFLVRPPAYRHLPLHPALSILLVNRQCYSEAHNLLFEEATLRINTCDQHAAEPHSEGKVIHILTRASHQVFQKARHLVYPVNTDHLKQYYCDRGIAAAMSFLTFTIYVGEGVRQGYIKEANGSRHDLVRWLAEGHPRRFEELTEDDEHSICFSQGGGDCGSRWSDEREQYHCQRWVQDLHDRIVAMPTPRQMKIEVDMSESVNWCSRMLQLSGPRVVVSLVVDSYDHVTNLSQNAILDVNSLTWELKIDNAIYKLKYQCAFKTDPVPA